MCGRFTLTAPARALAELFDLADLPALAPRYNVAPTQPVLAVRHAGEARREVVRLRWGLVPSWADDLRIGARLLNARAETAAEKPAFRTALARRRCLVPADGFFEWRSAGGKKQPLWFRLRDGRPFALAGLWERWQAAEGVLVESCAVLTTEANELVRPVHERMPVILEPSRYDAWLDPHFTRTDLLRPWWRPWCAADMIAEPVSAHVNNPRHDDVRCVAPAPGVGTPGY
jgi:putative SOS response-associated peptidase YedK